MNNRIPAAGRIAGLRGTLAAAERGFVAPGVVVQGRATTRKIKDATAADVIRSAGDLIWNAVQDDAMRIAEADRLGHQIAALAKSKALIPAENGDGSHAVHLKQIWTTLLADPDIGGGAVRLEGLVGDNDALIILDRAL